MNKIITYQATNKAKPSKNIPIFRIVLFVLLALYFLTLVTPLLWGLLTSLKSPADYNDNIMGFPRRLMFYNYYYATKVFYVRIATSTGFANVFMSKMILNTLLYAGGCAFMATATPCVMGYLTAKFKCSFSKIVYAIVIVTMVLPIIGSLPSELHMSKSLGLYNTFWGVWIMKGHFLGIYFLVFHAAFKGISATFIESAKIDGAGNLRIFVQIILPLVRNVFFTVMLIKFIEFWNDYQVPLLYMPSMPTLAYGLWNYTFNYDNAISSVPLQMTGCMIVFLPIFAVFLAFHNRLIGNISMGGIKE